MSVEVLRGGLFTVFKFNDGVEIYLLSNRLIEKIPNPERIQWRNAAPSTHIFGLIQGINSVVINGITCILKREPALLIDFKRDEYCEYEDVYNSPIVQLEPSLIERVGSSSWYLGRTKSEMLARFHQIISMYGDLTPRILLLQNGFLVLTFGDKFAQYLTDTPETYSFEEQFLEMDDLESSSVQALNEACRSRAITWINTGNDVFSETLLQEVRDQIVREVHFSEIRQGFLCRNVDLFGVTSTIRPRPDVHYISGVSQREHDPDNYYYVMAGPDYTFEIDLREPGIISIYETAEYSEWRNNFIPDDDIRNIFAETAQDATWISYSSFSSVILEVGCIIIRDKCREAEVPFFSLFECSSALGVNLTE